MSEMMAPFLDVVQPYHDAGKLDSNVFPDALHCYDFFPEIEIENSCFNLPKLVDSPAQLQSSPDQVFFDLNVNDIQFSDLLLVPGVSTHDDLNTKSVQMTPEICQNLSEDIFKSYPCLADAMTLSFDQQNCNVALSSSCDVQQMPDALTELDMLTGSDDVLHDRFKTRSLSLDSAFANFENETRRFLGGKISTTSTYSEYTEMHPLEATSVINLDTLDNSTYHIYQQSFLDGNSTTGGFSSAPGNKFERNELHACSVATQERAFEDASTVNSFPDSIYQVQFLSESNQSVDPDKVICGESPQSINEYNDSSVQAATPITNETDSHDEFCSRDVSSPPEFLLPSTLDSVSCETSAEVSLESLPESVLHLDAVPKATSAASKPTSRRKRGRKLWEFLLDLLEDPGCNPSLIRWEDKAKGVFRLKEQEVIARKWGKRREKKDNLSYDYFARALRYHYKSKMLVSVPERKLVYKFGPKVLSEMK